MPEYDYLIKLMYVLFVSEVTYWLMDNGISLTALKPNWPVRNKVGNDSSSLHCYSTKGNVHVELLYVEILFVLHGKLFSSKAPTD